MYELCMNVWLMRKIVHVWWNWSYSCMPAQNTETFYLIQHSMNDLSNILLKMYIWYLLPSYFIFFFSVWTSNIFFFGEKILVCSIGDKNSQLLFFFLESDKVFIHVMWMARWENFLIMWLVWCNFAANKAVLLSSMYIFCISVDRFFFIDCIFYTLLLLYVCCKPFLWIFYSIYPLFVKWTIDIDKN